MIRKKPKVLQEKYYFRVKGKLSPYPVCRKFLLSAFGITKNRLMPVLKVIYEGSVPKERRVETELRFYKEILSEDTPNSQEELEAHNEETEVVCRTLPVAMPQTSMCPDIRIFLPDWSFYCLLGTRRYFIFSEGAYDNPIREPLADDPPIAVIGTVAQFRRGLRTTRDGYLGVEPSYSIGINEREADNQMRPQKESFSRKLFSEEKI
ncbi:hypothetical protein ILUMI_02357 [Ignelater luminosus]|uniref:Uncharacterized protein n=1 Tax=Ignelater luminosus TaxID=2038154 RepID=A0A8K0DNW6_IGNLU|nr:hypothetical protein ILUMI_02357 [Ignelater luminosus]